MSNSTYGGPGTYGDLGGTTGGGFIDIPSDRAAKGAPPGLVLGLEAIWEYQDLVMNDRRSPDQIRLTDIEGLVDADVRDSRAVNPNYDGETAYNAYAGGRTVALQGTLRSYNLAKMRAMIATAKRAFAGLQEDILFARQGVVPFSSPVGYSTSALDDSVRQANTDGDGLTYPDGSVGLWDQTTNLVTNAGLSTNTTGYSTPFSGSDTNLRDSARSKFGNWSYKATKVGTADTRFARYTNAQVYSTGTTYTVSAWIYSTLSTGTIKIALENSGGTVASQTVIASSATLNTWVRIQTKFTMSVSGTVNFNFDAQNTAAVGSVWIDGVQAENRAYATPVVHTDGAAVTRPASSAWMWPMQTGITPTQGWIAVRLRMEVAGADMAAAGVSSGLAWTFGSSRRVIYYDGTNWNAQSWDDVTGPSFSTPSTVSRGTTATLILAWTAPGSNDSKFSVNGGAFVLSGTRSGGNANPGASNLTIGEILGFHGTFEVLWMAMGTGTLTNADAVTINNLGDTGPANYQQIPGLPTFLWQANDTGTDGPLVRSGGAGWYERFLDLSAWINGGTKPASVQGGTLSGTAIGGPYQILRANSDPDVEMQALLNWRGYTSGSGTIFDLVLKKIMPQGSGSIDALMLGVRYLGDSLSIFKTDSTGAVTTLATLSIPNMNQPLYLHGRVIGNEIRAEIGTLDHFEQVDWPTISNLCYELRHTLSTANAQSYGAGVPATYSGARYFLAGLDQNCELIRMSPKRSREALLRARKVDKLGIKETQDSEMFQRDFMIGLRASSPSIRSTMPRLVTIAPGSAVVTPVPHPGSRPSGPLVRINGPGNLWSIYNDTDRVAMILDCTLSAGQFYLIDCENRTIVDQTGKSALGVLAITNPPAGYRMDWPLISPGGSIFRGGAALQANPATGTGIQLHYRDAYI